MKAVFIRPVFCPAIAGLFLCMVHCKFYRMKEKIIAYLSGPRPYREGIALYEEYGLNLMLKASFRRNAETDLLRATLMEELRKLAGISETAFRTMQRKAVDSPHISSASIVVEEIKAEKTAVNVPVTPVVENVIRFRDRFPFLNSPDCPDVLKILVADMFTAYDLYLKTFRELGELIGNATSNKSGLMSSGMVPLELSKDNNQYCKISVFMPNAGSINESVISVTNVGGDSFSVAVSMIRWNANKVFCKLINGTKISNINMYYTVDTERFCFYIKANWYAKIIVSRLGLVNTSKIESINAIPSGAIEVPIS